MCWCALPEPLFSSLFVLQLALWIAGTPERYLGFVFSLISPGFFFFAVKYVPIFYLARGLDDLQCDDVFLQIHLARGRKTHVG